MRVNLLEASPSRVSPGPATKVCPCDPLHASINGMFIQVEKRLLIPKVNFVNVHKLLHLLRKHIDLLPPPHHADDLFHRLLSFILFAHHPNFCLFCCPQFVTSQPDNKKNKTTIPFTFQSVLLSCTAQAKLLDVCNLQIKKKERSM